MQTHFPDAHLLLSGYQVVAQDISNEDKLTVLKSLGETIQYLDEL